MNNVLAQVIDNTCPKINSKIINGIAKELLSTAPEYLDEIFRSSIKSVSRNVDFKYLGYRVLTPEEAYNKLTTTDPNKIQYDLAVSNVYVIEFLFSFNGEELSKQIYLLYADDGNLTTFSNTQYIIKPILSDTVISPSYDGLFVRLLKDKISITSFPRNFIINGRKIPKDVISTEIMRTSVPDNKDNIGKPVTSLALYILGEYGIRETFKKYFNIDEYVITNGNVDHLRDTHNVYESTKFKPKSLKGFVYIGHDVKICIPKSVNSPRALENLIFGIIYTLDIFPNETNDLIEVLSTGDVQKELYFWRALLGRISCKDNYGMDRIIPDTNEHFEVLQGYLDTLIKTKLSEGGIFVDNFFDLLICILENYNTWVLKSKEYTSDLNNRYIDIMYYLMYEIIVGFNKVILSINRRATKPKEISTKEIVKIVSNSLGTKKIFGLVKSTTLNLTLQVSDNVCDNYYMKITSELEDQSRGDGVKKGKNSQLPPAVKSIRGHDIYLGSVLYLGKSAPSPRFRSNLYLDYNIYTGKIKVPEYLKKELAKLDNLLVTHTDNVNINLLEENDYGLLK